MTVESMLDVRISEHVFRLTRVEARRLRDMLTAELRETKPASTPIDLAWPPMQCVPELPAVPAPLDVYRG